MKAFFEVSKAVAISVFEVWCVYTLLHHARAVPVWDTLLASELIAMAIAMVFPILGQGLYFHLYTTTFHEWQVKYAKWEAGAMSLYGFAGVVAWGMIAVPHLFLATPFFVLSVLIFIDGILAVNDRAPMTMRILNLLKKRQRRLTQ